MSTFPQEKKERREATRRNIFIPIICRELIGGKPEGKIVEFVVRDMSMEGASFKSKVIVSVGTLLSSEIYLPSAKVPISPTLRVERVDAIASSEAYTIGVSFSSITDSERKQIVECLDNLDLYKILDEAKKMAVSDIHLTVGHPAVFRTKGKLINMDSKPIEDGQIKAMLYPILNEEQVKSFETNKELDFAFSPSIDSRYRVNMHLQKGFVEAALRSIPAKILDFKKLNLPEESLTKFCQEQSGLILISGKTGAGKTTTLTTMINYVNQNLQKVLISVEDPVEYIHVSKQSIIKQRELFSDTSSYAEALKHSLRQDPDIIVVSELLDAEAVSSALRAAETGHLVIATIHAPDTAQTIERILNMFPPEHGPGIRQQLSSSLIAILFQTLVPTTQGELAAATELLVTNSAVRVSIREGRFSQINFSIQTGSALGMYTLESSLNGLRDRGLIDDKIIAEYKRTDS